MQVPNELIQFLPCSTPDLWVEAALQHIDILLLDHAHCERKAASTALSLMVRYPQHIDLQNKMSQLAREELLHYEKVLQHMQARGVKLSHLASARYAKHMHAHIRSSEPERLIDLLIIGAYIEARSCERFAALIPAVDAELGKFYRSLLKSEARHFEDYLHLAQTLSPTSINDRITFFGNVEEELITSTDPLFRFHSGVPS